MCLQDGVKLAQAVQGAGGAAASPAVLAEALRSFERERTARSTPIMVKSRFMGALLQIRNPWVGLSQLLLPAAYPLHEHHLMSIACARHWKYVLGKCSSDHIIQIASDSLITSS